MRKGFSSARPAMNKYDAEESFWIKQVGKLVAWYNGALTEHYQTPSPTDGQKIRCRTVEHSAILTWFELHQKPKYAADLRLPSDAFSGMRILDVGSGPMPSAEVFAGCELYCLDPLIPNYLRAGYPLHCYRPDTRFVCGYSESMPFNDGFFDAVISMNAIDHVDDVYLTAREIQRVLKPGGSLRIHAHYHHATPTEPLELNDSVMREAFGWCPHFKKIHETDKKVGSIALPGESYALWTNFGMT